MVRKETINNEKDLKRLFWFEIFEPTFQNGLRKETFQFSKAMRYWNSAFPTKPLADNTTQTTVKFRPHKRGIFTAI